MTALQGLPDFRNLGVILRILILGELANIVVFVAYAPDGLGALSRIGESGLAFEMALLFTALVLFAVSPILRHAPVRIGMWLVVGLAVTIAVAADSTVRSVLGPVSGGHMVRAGFVAASLAFALLVYLDWRCRVLSPALAESRLIALQARIRPHFLFNSINTALSVVRDDPKRAEDVLLDMSDLFRIVLAEQRALVPLESEIRVARAYLDIEQTRLGPRLRVQWHCRDVPMHALVPVLILQPLVENAVWHGIEPSPEGGEITVTVAVRDKYLHLVVANPIAQRAVERKAKGNGMALANIRERLALHFDAEAWMRVSEKAGRFVVQVQLPLTGS